MSEPLTIQSDSRNQVSSEPGAIHTVVGNDVWIGYESLIMPGVHIGDGAIIAARSVVVSNVDAYTVVGGNPAKPIRHRFSQDVIDELLEIAWWNWDAEVVTASLEAIVSGDIEALRAVARSG